MLAYLLDSSVIWAMGTYDWIHSLYSSSFYAHSNVNSQDCVLLHHMYLLEFINSALGTYNNKWELNLARETKSPACTIGLSWTQSSTQKFSSCYFGCLPWCYRWADDAFRSFLFFQNGTSFLVFSIWDWKSLLITTLKRSAFKTEVLNEIGFFKKKNQMWAEMILFHEITKMK